VKDYPAGNHYSLISRSHLFTNDKKQKNKQTKCLQGVKERLGGNVSCNGIEFSNFIIPISLQPDSVN